MFQKKYFLQTKTGGKAPPGPRSDGTEFAKRYNFFFYRN